MKYFPTMKLLGGSDSGKKTEKIVQAEEKAAEKIDFSKVEIEERLHLLMVDDHIPAGAKLY